MGIMAETLDAVVGPYERLSAEAATLLSTKRTASGEEVAIGIPQVVTISGRLENGALALERHLGLAADETTPGSRLTIWGLEGTLEYRFGDRIWFAPRGRPLESAAVPGHLQRGWQVEQDFIEAVRRARSGEPWSVSPDFEEGLLYMRKVEAVHRAAASGRSIRPADL
jgi:predicted dehydrogenase